MKNTRKEIDFSKLYAILDIIWNYSIVSKKLKLKVNNNYKSSTKKILKFATNLSRFLIAKGIKLY